MQKRLSLLLLTLAIGLLVLPGNSVAELQALSDTQMEMISGQGGLSLALTDTLEIDLSIDTLYYGDDDGANGNGKPAYISLCGITMDSSLEFHSPLTLDVTTVPDSFGAMTLNTVNLAIRDMTVRIDDLYVEAVRVGSLPGTGASFGAVGITNLVARIKGDIRVCTF